MSEDLTTCPDCGELVEDCFCDEAEESEDFEATLDYTEDE